MKFIFFVALLWSFFYFGSYFYLQDRMRFNLHTHHANLHLEHRYDFKPVTQYVTTRDGKRIAFWHFPVEKSRGVVILIHGYGNPGGKSVMIGHAQYLKEAGYTTALVDLRAYGESEGDLISLGVHEWKDVEAVYDYLKVLPENRGKKIGYLGISMGGTSAIIANGETGKGDFVIASVPYASFDRLFSVQLQHQGLPPQIFLPIMKQVARAEIDPQYEKYTAARNIPKLRVPVLVISATEDDVVNGDDATYLYTLAREPKEYWEVVSKHDVFYYHPEEFKNQILDFLHRHVDNNI